LFILEYKFHFSEEEALKLPRWISKKRLSQLEEYKAKLKEEAKKLEGTIKKKLKN